MQKDFIGTIVEESLDDNRVLNDVEIIRFRITKEENPAERWHLYKVKVSKEDIEKLSKYIKPGKWYMHFWEGTDVVAIFKDKIFEFNYSDKATWEDALNYGRSLGIPEDQLDFIIE
jgi:hypothetical protein